MRDLYQASDLQEAQLLVDRLHEVGVESFVRNEALQGALGELPLTLRPVVAVLHDGHLELAARVLREFVHLGTSEPPPDQRCTRCGEVSPGNFELCWSCRAPFEEGFAS